jgi:hypothetical protein
MLAVADARADENVDAPQLAQLESEITGPKLPPPFALPELTHPRSDARIDWIVGGADGATIGLLRPSMEAKLGALRRVYVGATWSLAAASVDDAASKVAGGNIEGHARIVFPMPSWLAFGTGLGIVFPTARWSHGSPAQAAAVAAATFEPTEMLALTPDAIGLRPVLDMRVVRGPFVAQLRDGLDFAFDTASDYRLRTTGRLLLHLGLLASPDTEVSLEATQQYFFTNGDYYGPDVSDANRTAMTFGPGIRVAFRDVDLGLATTTNIGSPLAADGTRFSRFVAVRLSIVSHPFGIAH